MMKAKYTAEIINKFYKKNLSKDVQSKFQEWFLGTGEHLEKRFILSQIWEKEDSKADASTYIALDKIHQRIKEDKKVRHSFFRKRYSRIAAIFILLLISNVYLFISKQPAAEIAVEQEWIECFVPYGEQKQVHLSDGSEVWINPGSILIYEKEFKGKNRTLFLNGEASFFVTKNPDKPFIVKTTYLDIEALGTVFNVQSYSDTEKTIATLESGSIKIDTKATTIQSIILTPNQQVVYDRQTDQITKKNIDATKSANWVQGFLVFQGSSFIDIAKTIERRFGVTVNYEVDKYAGRLFTLRFSQDESLTDILDILQEIIGFHYKIKGTVVNIM